MHFSIHFSMHFSEHFNIHFSGREIARSSWVAYISACISASICSVHLSKYFPCILPCILPCNADRERGGWGLVEAREGGMRACACCFALLDLHIRPDYCAERFLDFCPPAVPGISQICAPRSRKTTQAFAPQDRDFQDFGGSVGAKSPESS